MINSPSQWYDAYVFDLDGTIYLGDELLPGARRLIERLRAEGKAVSAALDETVRRGLSDAEAATLEELLRRVQENLEA